MSASRPSAALLPHRSSSSSSLLSSCAPSPPSPPSPSVLSTAALVASAPAPRLWEDSSAKARGV
eukprot:457591-Prorocentrum_minimum.AAC.4